MVKGTSTERPEPVGSGKTSRTRGKGKWGGGKKKTGHDHEGVSSRKFGTCEVVGGESEKSWENEQIDRGFGGGGGNWGKKKTCSKGKSVQFCVQ